MAIGRVVLVLVMLLAPAVSAVAQTVAFGHAELTVVTGDGRGHVFAVEVATSPEQLAQGLMFRKALEPNAGMLFDFGQPRQVAMWMKNTLIPLDMLFIDRGGRVIFVEQYAVPGTLQPRGPAEPVLAVLEVAAGTARRLGLKAGDRVEHSLFKPAP